jgi:tetratricopeptide (TPR) repeat protein
MNNFFELEKKCKKYYQKKTIILYSFLFILAILIITFLYLFSDEKVENRVIKEPKKEETKSLNQEVKNVNKKSNIVEKNVSKKLETKKEIVLKEDEVIPTLEAKINLDMIEFNKNVLPNTKKTINKETNKTVVEVNQTEINKTIKTEKPKRVIITTKELPSFTTSFKLMNLYFKDGDYEKSKEWAVKASKIEPQNEEIWRVYALSLYKLNKKDKAIKVLKTYLQYKKSTKIEQTLKLIEEGR